jgi:beta-phosphoglucomutase family hydrolase
MLGLPDSVTACLFDLDGVLTDTTPAHMAAWTETFDDFLRVHAELTRTPFVPFDPRTDYALYVDGRHREDGVRAFLASRGIHLPEGAADDSPAARTVHGIGNRKNALLLRHLREGDVRAYEGSRRFLQAAHDAGMRRAVVSASANTAEVLESAGLADLIEVRVDAVTANERGLAGKPAPDMFVHAAGLLDAAPQRAAVFEDALAGVQAAHTGGFGCVVGVDRAGQAGALLEEGADVVVGDLAELLEPPDDR